MVRKNMTNKEEKQLAESLIDAAEADNFDKVKYLIEKGVNVNAQNLCGVTALMRASRKGHIEIVNYLIEKDADILISADIGQTALGYAICLGDFDLVKFFVEKGADVKDLFFTWFTDPIQIKLKTSNIAIISYLKDHGASASVVLQKAKEKKIATLKKQQDEIARKGHLEIQGLEFEIRKLEKEK